MLKSGNVAEVKERIRRSVQIAQDVWNSGPDLLPLTLSPRTTPMFRFTIRKLVLLTLVVAMGVRS